MHQIAELALIFSRFWCLKVVCISATRGTSVHHGDLVFMSFWITLYKYKNSLYGRDVTLFSKFVVFNTCTVFLCWCLLLHSWVTYLELSWLLFAMNTVWRPEYCFRCSRTFHWRQHVETQFSWCTILVQNVLLMLRISVWCCVWHLVVNWHCCTKYADPHRADDHVAYSAGAVCVTALLCGYSWMLSTCGWQRLQVHSAGSCPLKLKCVLKILVFWDVMLLSLWEVPEVSKDHGVCIFRVKQSWNTWRRGTTVLQNVGNYLSNLNLEQHCCENLKSCIELQCFLF